MIIHLSKDLERFVHDAVRAVRYASEDAVVNDSLARLRQALPQDIVVADRRTRRKKPAQPKKEVRTETELRQHMLEIGSMS